MILRRPQVLVRLGWTCAALGAQNMHTLLGPRRAPSAAASSPTMERECAGRRPLEPSGTSVWARSFEVGWQCVTQRSVRPLAAGEPRGELHWGSVLLRDARDVRGGGGGGDCDGAPRE